MTNTALFSLSSLQLLVLVTLLLLPLMADVALSAHAVCTWVPGPGSPLQYEYRHYCYARLIIRGPSSADYQCIPNAATPTAIVADWGKRGKELLEWREHACSCRPVTPLLTLLPTHTDSPCGPGGGYGKAANGRCGGTHWALCFGDSSKGECRYMAAEDDCAWLRGQSRYACTERLLPHLLHDRRVAQPSAGQVAAQPD